MKRFFFLLFALVGLLGIVYMLTTVSEGPDLLTLVPQESAAVIVWHEPGPSYQNFMGTKLGRKIHDIDWLTVFSTLGLRDTTVSHAEHFGRLWESFVKSRVCQDILGGQIVIALVKNTSPAGTNRPGGAQKTVLLCKVKRRSTVKNIRYLLGRSKFVKPLPTLSYQGYAVYGFQLHDLGHFYLSAHKDILIAALDPAAIRQSIDLLLAGFVGKGTTIKNNQQFVQLYRRTKGKSDFFCYLDPAAIGQSLESDSGIKENTGDRLPRFLLDIARRGLRRIAFFHQRGKLYQREEQVHQFSLVIRFDDQKLAPFQKLLADRRPVVDGTLAHTTANLQLYLWSNWLDLPAWWRMTREYGSVNDKIRAQRLDDAIQRYTGMDMDRFLSLFGHRFSLLIKEFKTSGFFPVPRVCLQVALTDSNVVGSLLETFSAVLPHHRDTVANLEVVSILAGGGLMQPSYALSDDDLLVVDGRDLVDDILKPDAFLVQDPAFTKVEIDSKRPANLLFFTRVKQVTRSLQELASWLGTLIAIEDSRAGARSKILVDQLALPVLDGLTMFKTIFINGQAASGELVLQTKILVNGEGSEKQ